MNFKSPSLQKSFTTYTLKKVKGFTLIELLIVIGILAILATIVLLVINPAQLIKQARDANRLTELNQIDKALALFESFGGTNMGLSNNVYVSIPCDQADFINLPALSPGYVYSCSSSANFRKTNGSGWLPVDLTSIQSQAGNLFSALPIDPINIVAGGLYYTYIKGSWALSAAMESERYTSANTINDGGQVPARFEMGNNLALNGNLVRPWTCGDTLTDSRDSKEYTTVQISSQCWMAKNLDYDNGCSAVSWVNNTDVGWCGYYTGGPFANEGLLYQWSAAMNNSTSTGARGLCPTSWHISTDSDWDTLDNYLTDLGQTCGTSRGGGWGYCSTAGTKLKVG